jgi:hypothetical protein
MRDLQVQSQGLKPIARIKGVTRALATVQGCRCAILNSEARLRMKRGPEPRCLELYLSVFSLHSLTLFHSVRVRGETDSMSQASTGKPAVIFFRKGNTEYAG